MSQHQPTNALVRRSAFALVAGVALLAAGCGSSSSSSTTGGPRWTSETRNTFTASLDMDGFRELGFDLRWSGAAVMTRGARVARADVLGDGIVVQESKHAVSMLRAETGEAVWSTVLGNSLTRFVGNARSGDRVYVASDVELFVLSAQTGDLLDRHPLDILVNTPPVVTGGAAFFGSPTGRVLAHDVRTGQGRWQYQLEGTIVTTPVLVGDHVGVASQGGDVIVLNPATGKASARGRAFDGPGGAIDATDAVVAVASRDQSVYGFSATGGNRLWRYRTESQLSGDVRIIDDIVYVSVPRVGMVGLDAYSGDVVWTASGVSGAALGVVGGNVLVRSGSDLLAVDDHGEVVARVSVPGLHTAQMSDPLDGDLYLVTDRGAVSRFNRR